MKLTAKTVAEGLSFMAQRLRNAPDPIDDQLVDEWLARFGVKLSAEAFMKTCRACADQLPSFPTPPVFDLLAEPTPYDFAEMAWWFAKRAMESAGETISAAEVSGNRATLWAMAAVGRDALDKLRSPDCTSEHDARTKAKFVRCYRIAYCRGWGMDVWDGGPPPLPHVSPVLPQDCAAPPEKRNSYRKKVFIIAAFDGREAREAKRALAEQGHEVLNPERTSLRESVRLLCEADAVHIVHGYGSSGEASLLAELASRLSLEDIGLNDVCGQ